LATLAFGLQRDFALTTDWFRYRLRSDPGTIYDSNAADDPATGSDDLLLREAAGDLDVLAIHDQAGLWSFGSGTQISIDWTTAGAVDITLELPWNAIKAITASPGGDDNNAVVLQNFVDATLDASALTDDLTLRLEGSKRGTIVTGSGSDSVVVEVDSNGPDPLLNGFDIRTGDGADFVDVHASAFDWSGSSLNSGTNVPYDPAWTRSAIATGSGDDTVLGGDGVDQVDLGSGNDTLTGRGGDDLAVGGLGTDSFVLRGDRDGYTIRFEGERTIVEDIDPTDGDDGTDTLESIERLVFDDRTVSVRPLEFFFAAARTLADGTTLTELWVVSPEDGTLTQLPDYQGGFAVLGDTYGYVTTPAAPGPTGPTGPSRTFLVEGAGETLAWRGASPDGIVVSGANAAFLVSAGQGAAVVTAQGGSALQPRLGSDAILVSRGNGDFLALGLDSGGPPTVQWHILDGETGSLGSLTSAAGGILPDNGFSAFTSATVSGGTLTFTLAFDDPATPTPLQTLLREVDLATGSLTAIDLNPFGGPYGTATVETVGSTTYFLYAPPEEVCPTSMLGTIEDGEVTPVGELTGEVSLLGSIGERVWFREDMFDGSANLWVHAPDGSLTLVDTLLGADRIELGQGTVLATTRSMTLERNDQGAIEFVYRGGVFAVDETNGAVELPTWSYETTDPDAILAAPADFAFGDDGRAWAAIGGQFVQITGSPLGTAIPLPGGEIDFVGSLGLPFA